LDLHLAGFRNDAARGTQARCGKDLGFSYKSETGPAGEQVGITKSPGVYCGAMVFPNPKRIWNWAMSLVLAGAIPGWAEACRAPQAIQEKLKEHPTAAAYSAAGTWFAKQQRYGCAAEAFQKAVEKEPESAQLAYLLGLSLSSAGNAKAAVAPLRRSVQLDPRLIEAHLTLAAALEELGDKAGAEGDWRAALAIDPSSAIVLNGLSQALLAERDYDAVIALFEGTTGPLAPQLAVNLSAAYSKSGRLEEASQVLHASLEAHEDSLALHEALAGVLVLQSRVQEAIETLEAALKAHPDDLDGQVLYLRTLVLAREASKAKELGGKLLAAHPRNWELLYLNGVLSREAGQYAAARNYLQQSVALNPGDANAHYNLGVSLAELKQNSDARMHLEQAMALGFDAPEVHVELAKVLKAAGDNDGAQAQLKLYQQTLKAQSDRTQAASKAELGDQAMAKDDALRAAGLYREALAANPTEPLLAYKLAMALDKAGDPAGEHTALERAIQLDPHMALAQNQLGYLASRAGDSHAAEERFRLAVQGSPRYAKGWMNLAATLTLESKWQEAREALGHVLQLDPGNARARQLNSRIDAMEAQR
jgi:Flp pilus assembly protein TadD